MKVVQEGCLQGFGWPTIGSKERATDLLPRGKVENGNNEDGKGCVGQCVNNKDTMWEVVGAETWLCSTGMVVS